MLLLTETNVEEGAVLTEKLRNLVASQRFPVETGQEISVTISIGIAGGGGGLLRDRHARPRRRRRDVLGEVARAEPDLRLRRAGRGRPGAARADLAGRPGPRLRDRPERPGRRDGEPDLASSRPCPTIAASRRR